MKKQRVFPTESNWEKLQADLDSGANPKHLCLAWFGKRFSLNRNQVALGLQQLAISKAAVPLTLWEKIKAVFRGKK